MFCMTANSLFLAIFFMIQVAVLSVFNLFCLKSDEAEARQIMSFISVNAYEA